jgi:hypothetical protein
LKVLLDQNLAHDLRELLTGHAVTHARDMGWNRLENGALLAAAEEAGFDAFLTADKNLRYQQNLSRRRIAIVVVSTNHWPTMQAGSWRILAALEALSARGYAEVSLDRPKLRRRPAP